MRRLLVLSLLLLACHPAHADADPDADVLQRQQLFRDMQAALATLDQIGRSGDADKGRDELKENAQKLAMLSGQPWTLFGRETTIARRQSHAGPMIWADPAGFRTDSAKLGEAAQKLNIAAPKITAEDLRKSVTEITATCDTCHQTYKN